jgi:two-component system cell cycle response regulator DivK
MIIPQGWRALVVDDIPANRMVAQAMLEKMGWQVTTADGGREGLNELAKMRYELVLLDISMPGTSGIEICQQIRINPAYSDIAVIAYTAHALPEDRNNFIASGFNEVLLKPITRDTLTKAVESAIGHRDSGVHRGGSPA